MPSTEKDGVRYYSCCLCNDILRGYGNNPEPVISSWDEEKQEELDVECCDDCNFTKVIPARMKESGLI
jgi:hypothetical protein